MPERRPHSKAGHPSEQLGSLRLHRALANLIRGTLVAERREQVHPGDQAASLDELRRQVEELRQEVRARDDFIAIAAHEMRNPMTSVLAMAELALAAARKAEGACPPRVTGLLQRLQHVVQDYIKRATTLLDLGRIESGNLRLEPTAIDLSSFVLAIAQNHEDLASRGGSSLEVDIEGGISTVLDPLAVEQVIDNLLSNALKFGIGKPVTVRLSSDGQAARLAVQDRGIGMPADQQERVFGRFEQIMTHHRGSGFGVGLWVANRLVSAMGGRIDILSRLEEGSTFTVTFPLTLPEVGSEDA
jgi:two-component system, OmpR family, sensor kinase